MSSGSHRRVYGQTMTLRGFHSAALSSLRLKRLQAILGVLCGLAILLCWSSPALAAEEALSPGIGAEAANSATSASANAGSQVSTRPPDLGAEVKALRTAKSRTFRGSDGSLVAELFPDEANYKDAAGNWQAIDTSLHSASDGGWQNGASSFSLSLPRDLGQSPVALRAGDASVALQLLGASGSPTVGGDVAEYHEALSKTDVSYQSLADGVKETLVLASPAAPSTFRFHLDLASSLTPRLESDGSIAVVDVSGVPRFVIPAPTMHDASGASPSEEMAGTQFAPQGSVSYSLASDTRGWTIGVNMDRRWLQAAGRKYPVTIDPTVMLNGQAGDCTVESAAPTQSFCGLSDLTVQKAPFGSTSVDDALLKFDLSTIPQDSVVDTATFGFLIHESSGSEFPISVSAVDSQWSSPTWNTARSGVYWSCAGGGYYGPGCTTAPEVPTCSFNALNQTYCDLPAIVQDLQNGLVANNGLLIYDSHSYSSPIKIYSGESSHPPTLYIQYQPNTGERPQYTYHRLAIDDRIAGSVNLGTGNMELKQADLTEPDPNGVNLEVIRHYSSLRARQNPTDFREFSPGWLLNMGSDVELSTIAGEHRVLGSNMPFIAGWQYHAPDGSALPVASGNGPLNGIVPGGDGAQAHWNPGPAESSCTTTRFPTVTENASNQSYIFEQAAGTCSNTTQVLYPNDIYDRYNGYVQMKYTLSFGKVALSELLTSSGQKYHWESSNAGHLTELTDPLARRMEYGYETGTKYLSTFTDMAGKKTTYTYDSSGQPLITKITTPAGRVVKFTYEESSGRLLSITREDATLGNPQWTFAYHQPLSNPSCIPQSTNQEARYCTIETDPMGNKTGYTFDAWNRLVGKIEPLGQQDSAQYTGHSNLRTSTTGTGSSASTTSYAYAPTTEAPSATTAPTGYTTATEYTNPSIPYLPTVTIDPQQRETDDEYSGAGALARVLPQLARNTPGQFDKNPAPEKEVFQYGTPACLINEGNEILPPVVLNSHESGSGSKTTYCYDRNGDLRETRPPSPLHASTQTVDAAGRPKETTDGDGHTTKLTYDGIDRVTKEEYGDGSSVKYVYDGDGNVTERVDPTGTTKYVYDGLGLLTEEVHPPGGTTGTTTYTYYANGQLHQATGAGGTTTYTYNANDELKTIVDPSGTTTFCYGTCGTNPPDQNPRNDLTEIDYPNGTVTTYQYDIGDRITNIKTTGPAGTLQNLTYSYQQGTQDRALVQNVTDSVANTCTQYTYDYLNRLTLALVTSGTTCTGSQVAEYEYGYDADSNLTAIHHYGAVGITICSTTQAMNLADELTTFSNTCGTPSATYTFDGAGNQTAAGSSTAFGYNIRNQYTSQGTATFAEAGKTNNELTNNNGTEVSQNQFGISATKPSGGSATYYTRAPDGTIIDERTPAGTYYYSTDMLGSITRLTNSTGQQVQAYSYDPYGNVTATPETGGPPNSFLFQAGYQATGQQKNLLQFGARFFDPVTGRWTQQDPQTSLANPNEANGYGFAGDNPINNSDPSGTCAFDRNLNPTIYTSGKYTYIQICGQHGKSAGKQVGYLRVATSAFQHHGGGRSLAGRIVEGVVGANVIVAAGIAGTLCSAAGVASDNPDLISHCVLGAGGGMIAGALALENATE